MGQIKTYSVATEDPALDESTYARAVAEQYATDHHEVPVRGNVRETLGQVVANMGEPMGDSSALNLFAISVVARESVKVVLTGDGADEIFGGYTHYLAHHYADRLQRFCPAPATPMLTWAGNLLQRGRGPVHRAGTILRLTGTPLVVYWRASSLLDEPIREALFTPEFKAQINGHDTAAHVVQALEGSNGALRSDKAMQAQLQTLMVDDYLCKVDLATMAASLEARCPFLDVDVVELAMRIPSSVRFRGNEPKGLLRELARRHVPATGVNRRKQGFLAPIGHWLRHEWRDLVDDFVLGPQVEQRGWFRRDGLERLVEEQRRGIGPGLRSHLLWTILMLEMWLRMTVDHVQEPALTV